MTTPANQPPPTTPPFPEAAPEADAGVRPPRDEVAEPELGPGGIENLKLLMDYTKFHIGLYVTLFSAIVVAIEKDILPSKPKGALPLAALLLVLAGAAGGVIGSSIPNASSFTKFQADHLGPLWMRGSGLRYKTWAALEHFFFWLAILVVAATLVIPRLFRS